MLIRSWRILRWIFTVTAAALTIGVEVPPGDAASNLAKWAEWLGIKDLPSVIATKSADHLVLIVASAILLICIGSWGVEYALLRTRSRSSAQIASDSPKSEEIETRTEHRFLVISDAVRYVADESQWAVYIRTGPHPRIGMRPNARFAAIDEIVRAARDGEINIFGRLNRTGEHQIISQQYWLHASIDIGSAIGESTKPAFTIPLHASLEERERFTVYDGLCVEHSDLIRAWPKAP